MKVRRRTPEKSRGSGLTEFFFEDGYEGPVLLFQHIQKTAGTSLRELIRSNLDAERVAVEYPKDLLPEELTDHIRRDAGPGLRCVMGHRANFGLAAMPADAITVLREPVDRVVSDHFFRGPQESLESVYADFKPSERSGGRYTNRQARSLLAPHFDVSELAYSRGPCDDAEMWRERLWSVTERYTIGTQDRLEDFADLLCERYGWQRRELIPRKRGKKSGPRARIPLEDLDPSVIETIREYNWLDVELYERFSHTA